MKTPLSDTYSVSASPLPAGIRLRENSWLAKMAAWKLKGHAAALVFGKTIHLYNISAASFLEDKAWVRHELKHVEQYRRLGKCRFLFLYFFEWLRKGYSKNRFEVEAREAERN